MKPSLQSKLEQLAFRLEEIDGLLADERATADLSQYRKLNQEHAEITPVVAHYHAWQQVQADLTTAEGLLADPDMKEFAQEEVESAKHRLVELDHELQLLLLPTDPNDLRNLFLEIRAGTGGNESALFAGDLLRMYSRYAPPCASPISPAAWWWNARMTARSTATRPRRWPCWPRA